MSQRQHYIHKTANGNGGIVHTAAVSGRTGVAMVTTTIPASVKSAPDVSSDADFSTDFQKWGPNNDKPTVCRLKLEDSTTAFPLIAKKVKMYFGKGLSYHREVFKNGVKTIDETPIEEVENFLLNNNIDLFHLEQMMDYGFINNQFAEFRFDKTGKKIGYLDHLEAEFTRFGKIDKDSYKIKNIRYEADWKAPTNKVSIPFVSIKERDRDEILKISGRKKFAMHNHFPSPGRTLYAVPPHEALFRKDGWLDFANSIPIIMNKVNQNANAINLHIEIPGDYWKRTVEGFESMEPEKQKEIIDAKIGEIEDFYKGEGATAQTFHSHFAVDHTGKYLSGWKITPIVTKADKDKFLTSLQEADLQIARALDADTSLANLQQAGGKMGAGSGSDKRTAYTNSLSMSHADMHIITAPLRFVQWFNEWDPAIKWTFKHDIPTTLNDEPSGVKPDQQP